MKQILGYLLGFTIFIAGIPALMWLMAGMPATSDIPVLRLYTGILIAVAGLVLSVLRQISVRSIWSIKRWSGAFYDKLQIKIQVVKVSGGHAL